jgi:hypothetical protein
VRSTFDRVSEATFSKVSHRMGDQNYLEPFRASEGTLSRWSLTPAPVSGRVDVRQAAGRKNNCRIFITT